MKTALLIYIALMLAIILLAAMPDKGYHQGYLDGYRAAQYEQLPGIGIDIHKHPAPELRGKG
jgi:hypothetical protein